MCQGYRQANTDIISCSNLWHTWMYSKLYMDYGKHIWPGLYVSSHAYVYHN